MPGWRSWRCPASWRACCSTFKNWWPCCCHCRLCETACRQEVMWQNVEAVRTRRLLERLQAAMSLQRKAMWPDAGTSVQAAEQRIQICSFSCLFDCTQERKTADLQLSCFRAPSCQVVSQEQAAPCGWQPLGTVRQLVSVGHQHVLVELLDSPGSEFWSQPVQHCLLRQLPGVVSHPVGTIRARLIP